MNNSAINKNISTDGTFAANSDGNIPTEKATKAYVDGHTPTLTWGSITGTLTSQADLNSALNLKQDISTLSTKGDIYAATGASSVTRLGAGANGQVLLANSGQSTGLVYADLPGKLYDNLLVNGGFEVNQRGTTFTNLSGSAKYFSDHWIGYYEAAGGHTLTVYDSTYEGLPTSKFIRFQKTAGNATNGLNRIIRQALETKDSVKLVGKYLTLSFWARKGATQSSSQSYAFIQTGTGTDQGPFGFSGYSEPAGGGINLTTSWQRYSFTTASPIASGVTQVGVGFYDTPLGTAGANDYYEITCFQLTASQYLTPYNPRSFEEELSRCQSWYQKSYNYDVAPGSNSDPGIWYSYVAPLTLYNIANAEKLPIKHPEFKARMRATPSVTLYRLTGTANSWRVNPGDYTVAVDTPSESGFRVINNTGGNISFAGGAIYGHYIADASL